jgi:hypothetical protein
VRASAVSRAEVSLPTMTFTWYAFAPSTRYAAAPRPAKHSKLGRLTEVNFASGHRPGLVRPPPLVAVLQPTTTITAPCTGTRYAAIWHCVDLGRTPVVPTTSSVRGSVTGPSPAEGTRCHPAGTVSPTPLARIIFVLAAEAITVKASTTTTEASNLISYNDTTEKPHRRWVVLGSRMNGRQREREACSSAGGLGGGGAAMRLGGLAHDG